MLIYFAWFVYRFYGTAHLNRVFCWLFFLKVSACDVMIFRGPVQSF